MLAEKSTDFRSSYELFFRVLLKSIVLVRQAYTNGEVVDVILSIECRYSCVPCAIVGINYEIYFSLPTDHDVIRYLGFFTTYPTQRRVDATCSVCMEDNGVYLMRTLVVVGGWAYDPIGGRNEFTRRHHSHPHHVGALAPQTTSRLDVLRE